MAKADIVPSGGGRRGSIEANPDSKKSETTRFNETAFNSRELSFRSRSIYYATIWSNFRRGFHRNVYPRRVLYEGCKKLKNMYGKGRLNKRYIGMPKLIYYYGSVVKVVFPFNRTKLTSTGKYTWMLFGGTWDDLRICVSFRVIRYSKWNKRVSFEGQFIRHATFHNIRLEAYSQLRYLSRSGVARLFHLRNAQQHCDCTRRLWTGFDRGGVSHLTIGRFMTTA